jgi:hypothetical protein
VNRAPALSRRFVVIALIATAGLLGGCGGGSPSPSGTASGAETPSPAPSSVESLAPTDTASPQPTATATPALEPTDSLGAFSCNQPAIGVGSVARAQITDVRVATHDGYDRIVFEFANGIPAYTIEPAIPPFSADGSGQPIDVAGTGFLRITLDGGTKVTPDGEITYAGPTNVEPDFDELTQLIEGGDFEAVSTWYAGLATEPCIRVFTLADPSRLVLDIQH